MRVPRIRISAASSVCQTTLANAKLLQRKKEPPVKRMAVEEFKLEEATIADIHHAFRARSLSCRELVQSYLDRIDAYDRNGPAFNSIVMVNQHALAEAERLDALFARSGEFAGP